jgi:hypothetical protein
MLWFIFFIVFFFCIFLVFTFFGIIIWCIVGIIRMIKDFYSIQKTQIPYNISDETK